MTSLDHLPCAVLVTDSSGRMVYANADMIELAGGSADSLTAQPMETLFPRPSQIFLLTHVWPSLFQTGNIREIYLHLYNAAGTPTPVFLNCERILVNGEERFYWVFFVAEERSRFEAELVRARTDSQRLAAKLEQANAELETLHRQLVDRAHKLELANFELARLSYADPLTGLANRRALAGAIREWQHGQDAPGEASLLMVDVDHFKVVNDRYGHDEGDRVLVLLADRLLLSVREQDLAVRYGGEEFVLWLPATDREGAEWIAQRVHHLIRDIRVAGESMTVSVGVATARGINGPQLMHRLIEQADKALYCAKTGGRNRTVHYPMPEKPAVPEARSAQRSR